MYEAGGSGLDDKSAWIGKDASLGVLGGREDADDEVLPCEVRSCVNDGRCEKGTDPDDTDPLDTLFV